jgi:hypothetical protein
MNERRKNNEHPEEHPEEHPRNVFQDEHPDEHPDEPPDEHPRKRIQIEQLQGEGSSPQYLLLI